MVTISKIRSANFQEWDTIFESCDYATYFHSREWAEIWSTYTKRSFICNPLLVVFSDKKMALVPLSYSKQLKGLRRNYISSPAGTFGGWISIDNLTPFHEELLFRYLLKKIGNLMWRTNPYDKLLFQTRAYRALVSIKNDTTHAINLEEGFDSVYRMWTKGHSSAVRKARKEGVEISCALKLDDWYKYYKVYEQTVHRWGENMSSAYSWDLFQVLFQRKSPNIKLWLATYQQEIIAGALCFYAKKHVVYWHGAALEEFFPLRPVNLLLYEAIKDACDKGYSWFDFNPSGGHEGVIKFKKSFGTTELSCPVIYTRDFLGKVISYLRMKVKI